MAIGTALAIASAAASVGSSIMQAKAAKKASSMVDNLQYQPIDLNKLQEQAQGFAAQNVAKSIELERQYMPEMSAARFGLQKEVATDLERGGMLPLDVANQVTRSTMAQAGAGGFGAGPLTAAQLGLTSYDIRQRALERARMLTEGTPLPVSGLDPGSLASAAIAQNQQQNQFNISKTGAQINALQSRTAANAGLLGNLGSIAGMIGKAYSFTPSGSLPDPTSFSSTFTNKPAAENFGFGSGASPMSLSNITTSTTNPLGYKLTFG